MLPRLALLVLVLAAQPAAAKLRIVATVSDLGAIAREIAGDQGQVSVLARPTQDPHFVDARPSLMLDLNRADLVFVMGADLETGWLPVLLRGARNARILPGQTGYLDASTLVQLKDAPTGKVDRALGDIHPQGNPHITTDPRNAVHVARGLAERLALADPGNAAAYQGNAEKFAAAAQAKISEWQAAFAPHKGTAIVTYHRSWIYFADFAGLVITGTLEPKPGIPPNAQHLAELIALMKARKVPLILQESWFNAAASQVVARQTGAQLVVVPGMTPEGRSYLEHVDHLVKQTVAAMARGARP